MHEVTISKGHKTTRAPIHNVVWMLIDTKRTTQTFSLPLSCELNWKLRSSYTNEDKRKKTSFL